MKFFLDTEFSERPGTIELISIGMVCENGARFYAENASFSGNCNEWVRDNVLPHLWGYGDQRWLDGSLGGGMLSYEDIRPALYGFITQNSGSFCPSFWGYYCDYDWVVFCWLFGTMAQLPDEFPKYCLDLKQYCNSLGNPRLPQNFSVEHNALNDAEWIHKTFEGLQRLEAENGQ